MFFSYLKFVNRTIGTLHLHYTAFSGNNAHEDT